MRPIEWTPSLPAGEARELHGELAWILWDEAVRVADAASTRAEFPLFALSLIPTKAVVGSSRIVS